MSNPSASFIVSTLTKGDWIASLKTVLTQNYEPYEVILIVDTPDYDAAGLRQLEDSYDHLKVHYNKQNLGLTKSLNKAAELATGDILVRHDDDDYSMPHRLKRITAFLAGNNLDIASSFSFTQYDFSENKRLETHPLTDGDIKQRLERRNCLNHPTLAIRAASFKKINGYNESFRYAQDYEFYLRAKRAGLVFGCLPEPLIRKIHGRQSVSVAKRRIQMLYSFAAQLIHYAECENTDLVAKQTGRFLIRFLAPQTLRLWKHRLDEKINTKSDILVIGVRGIPGVQGGMEKHAEHLFPRFAERGYNVTLLGMKQYIKQPSFQGVRLVGIKTLNFMNSDKVLYNLYALFYAAFKRPRLVHLQGLNAAMFLVFYRLAGLKIVMRYGSQDYLYPKWGPVGRFILRLCEKQLRYANHIITVSEHYRSMLMKKYNIDHVTAIPNGVEPLKSSDNAAACMDKYQLEGCVFILSVGRITREKDFDTLIAAVEDLENKEVCLVIAGGSGDDAYTNRLKKMKSDRIRFPGQVSRGDLAVLYEKSALYVCSSLHEGQSNAVLEASAFKRPIIASNIPANLEIGLNEVCYFPVSDAAALKDKITDALQNPAGYVSENSLSISWNEVFEKTRAVYQSVCPKLH